MKSNKIGENQRRVAQDIAVIEVPEVCLRVLAEHAVGHLLLYAFLGHLAGSCEAGAWCSDTYLGVFAFLHLLFAPTNGTFPATCNRASAEHAQGQAAL